MNISQDILYTRSHEWVRFDEGRAVVGISDYGQSQLGDIIVFEMPEVGDVVTAGLPFAEVESVKAVSSLFSPVNGVIIEVNDMLADAPETVNKDPYGEGWIIVIEVGEDRGQEELFSSDAYAQLIEPKNKCAANDEE